MQRVIVTVKRDTEAGQRDLEVPADLGAGQLAGRIAAALRWENPGSGPPLQYQIEARPLGRALEQHESLADAGVWDGAWLVLRAVGGGHPPASGSPRPADAPPPGAGPLKGWHPLGIDLPVDDPASSPPVESPRSGGYIWKQVDE